MRGAAAPDFSERDTMGDDKMHLASGAAAPNLSKKGDTMGDDRMHHACGAEAPNVLTLGNICKWRVT